MSHTASVTIKTAKASGYLQQLCKHFGHKTDVEFTPETGRITFEFGRADLQVGPGGLNMTAQAQNDNDLARLKRVLVSHLERFAFRETLIIEWED